MSFYLHHVPGRLRIQTAQPRGSDEGAHAACVTVRMLDGVADARVDPTTGSLLIRYDRQRLEPSSLWEALCECGLVAGDQPIADANGITRITRPDGQPAQLQTEFLGAFAEKLLERVAVALIGTLI